ncbi:hypothetical protein [Paenibacillus aestuarii]|uniref:Uncharacterized protein n=1 Tax=Paenibacillus aestuarii TaxID=516965 RepID=A0ABW0K7P2_9BACL|nr:hypothetical protein [Paenibacillus aestuarii]
MPNCSSHEWPAERRSPIPPTCSELYAASRAKQPLQVGFFGLRLPPPPNPLLQAGKIGLAQKVRLGHVRTAGLGGPSRATTTAESGFAQLQQP